MSLSTSTKPYTQAQSSWFVLALALGFASFMLAVFHDVDPRYSSPGAVFLGVTWLAAAVSVTLSLRDAARSGHTGPVRMAASLILAHVFYFDWLDQKFDGAPGAAVALAWLALASVVIVEAGSLFKGRQSSDNVDEF
ncbi:MAG: hypothetical protein ACPG4T_07115 [Nannocystaceae bacterium]